MRYLLGFLLLIPFVAATGAAFYFYRAAQQAADQAASRQADALAALQRMRAGEAELQSRLARAREELARIAEELECVGAAADDAGAEGRANALLVTQLRASRDDAQWRVKALEADLRAEIAQRKDVDEFLDKTAAAVRGERERHNKEIWQARQFMPEGLRLALRTVNELLTLDGRAGMRFLRADKIEDNVLHGVQMLDRDALTLGSTIYIAAEVTVDLDRIKGALTMSFRGGYSRGPHGREEFPVDGKRILLEDVNARAWEERLPFLVTAHGPYPVADTAQRAPPMERSRRLGWQGRINALLAEAKTDLAYRIDTFRGIEDGALTEALFLGYDEKKRLAMSVEAKNLWIQIDDRAGSVEVWLQEGRIRRKGGEVEIPSAGYRIQLTGLAPKRALDAMLGMVKRK